jgi:CheY-like chemotaxis protein/HPt (histidine-containing phosphotransfer) domain-containing protein
VILLTRGHLAGENPTGTVERLAKPVRRARLVAALQRAVELLPKSAADLRGSPVGAGRPGSRDAVRTETDRESARILVVEDDPINRLLVSTLLRKNGCEVITAASGGEAVEALERDRYDLVFMDVQMPGVDGLEATRRIRACEAQGGSRTPIVGLTAHALARDREQCLAAGMDDHLPKPVEPEQLFAAVAQHTSQKIELPELIDTAPADLMKLLRGLKGDEELLRSIIAKFLETWPWRVAELHGALRDRDGEAVSTAAHALRGSVTLVGAVAAGERLEELENLGESGELSGAPGVMEELEGALARVTEFLRAYLGEP